MKSRKTDKNILPGITSVVVMLLIVAGLSSASFAQLPQEQREAPPMEQQPQEQMQREIVYEETINEEELPETVLTSLKETWPDYEISESFRGSDGSLKVNLTRGDEQVAAFYDVHGEFLRVQGEIEEETINDDWR